MDQLEKLISGFKDEIQQDVPHEGHFERFEMKLNSQQKHGSKRWIRSIASVAAFVAITLLIFNPARSEKQSLTLSDVSEQYADVEFYYTSSIEQQTRRLTTINHQAGNDQSIELLLSELESYDQVYEQLCLDLNATPNDERVIGAMITYYQSKLEIINKILTELENKQKNSDNHENIRI